MNLIRGYIHLHSRHSYDGKLTLAEIREKCLSMGLNFAVMTEHTDAMKAEDIVRASQDCMSKSDGEFVFIPGFELPFKNCHILLIGTTNVDLSLSPLETIKAVKSRGAWIVLAHPHRNYFKVDPELMELLNGIEIWNQQYDGKYFPRIKAVRLFERNANKNQILLATAGLDMHRLSHFGGPYIELTAKLTQESILEQLKQGRYAIKSRGVNLNSRSKLSGVQRLTTILIGGALCTLIALAKKIGKWTHEHNVAMPKRLKEFIRRWI